MTLPTPLILLTALAPSRTASAKSGGRRSPGGRLTQSRVAATASATTWARSKASDTSCLRASGLSTTTEPGVSAAEASFFLYVVKV